MKCERKERRERTERREIERRRERRERRETERNHQSVAGTDYHKFLKQKLPPSHTSMFF